MFTIWAKKSTKVQTYLTKIESLIKHIIRMKNKNTMETTHDKMEAPKLCIMNIYQNSEKAW